MTLTKRAMPVVIIIVTLFALTFSPTLTAHANAVELTKIIDNGDNLDYFGDSVAVDGDLVVVGNYYENYVEDGAGSAAVYDCSTTPCLPVDKLVPINTYEFGFFGEAVAVSGTTVVVGAPGDGENGAESGAAYVYDCSSFPCTFSAKLTPSDAAAGDSFGEAVAIDGSTIVVGASYKDDGNTNTGAAYLFDAGCSTPCNETHKLTTSDLNQSDRFGFAVSIDGSAVTVSSLLDDDNGDASGSVYLFNTICLSPCFETKKFTPSDGDELDFFGYSVSISGSTVAIGSPQDDDTASASGSVYVFDTGCMAPCDETHKLNASDAGEGYLLGWHVDIDANTIIAGAYGHSSDTGKAYLFDATCTTPCTETKQLVSSDLAAGDQFGWAVAVDGSHMLVSALSNVNNGLVTGAVYLFDTGCSSPCNEVDKLLDRGNVDDRFGSAIAMQGDLLVIGSVGDDTQGSNAGKAEVYDCSSYPCVQVARLRATDVDAGDRFGGFIAIDGDTIVVGASAQNSIQGAAYLFDATCTGLCSETHKLTASDGAASDQFGSSVAIEGSTVIIGAYNHDSLTGAAYVFDTGCTSPCTEEKKLNASDAATDDGFGWDVAISGNLIAVSAIYEDADGIVNAGSIYVFEADCTAPCNEIKKLTPTNAAASNYFGDYLAIEGTTIVTSAPYTEDNGNDTGTGYIFDATCTDPCNETHQLVPSDPDAEDYFGLGLAFDGTTIALSAAFSDFGAVDSGSVYIFNKNCTSPCTEEYKIIPSTPQTDAYFGIELEIEGTQLVIAAEYEDSPGEDSGSVYIYGLSPDATPMDFTATYQPAPHTVELSWMDNVTNEDGYIIERKKADAMAWYVLDTTAADVTTFTDDTVTCDQDYVYRVTATNMNGDGTPVESSTVNTECNIFTDVPADGQPPLFEPWIEDFYQAGITEGCNGGDEGVDLEFCPTTEVNRGQMAVFILRALNYPSEYTPTGTDPNPFDDVPSPNLPPVFELWIEDFLSLGITTGCNPAGTLFCPEVAVDRGQMAVFILRALGITPIDDPTNPFIDVPSPNQPPAFEAAIETFYNEGITTGCNTGVEGDTLEYCPETTVDRGQMALFILRAFDSIPDPDDP